MKKNYFLQTAILSVALLFGAVPSFGAVDMLQNGSFEDWSGDAPTAWNGNSTNIAASGVSKSTDARTGSNALALTVTSTSHKRYSSQAYRLKPGIEYSFSFWAKGQGDVRNAYYNTETKKYSTYSGYTTINSTEWTQVTYTFSLDTKEGEAEGDYELVFSVKSTAETGIIIDDAELIDPSAEVMLADPELAFTGITGDINKVLTDGSYNSAATSKSDATIVYSSSNTNIATIDQKGLVTLVAGGGSTVIKAEVAETDKYYSSAIQYTLTVTDLSKAKTFNKVTDGIVTEGTYLITYQASDDATSVMAMNATNEKDYFLNTEFDITEGQITTDNQSVMWEIAQQSDGNYSISNGTIFAGYKGSGNNAYVYDSYNSDECGWKISYDNTTNLFKIQSATATEKDRYLQYNTGSPRFACYTGGQKDITLYKMEDNSGITTTEVNSMKIINGKGHVTVVTDKPESVAIYNLAGAQVRQIELVEGNNIIDLPAGIYVIGHQKVVVF